jgi:hypothetical protein
LTRQEFDHNVVTNQPTNQPTNQITDRPTKSGVRKAAPFLGPSLALLHTLVKSSGFYSFEAYNNINGVQSHTGTGTQRCHKHIVGWLVVCLFIVLAT